MKTAKFFAITALLIAAVHAAFCAPNTAASQTSQPATKSDIGYFDAAVLGLVEGITEYLPVSSTGHLILTNAFLKLDTDTPVLDSRGMNIMKTPEEPYTMKSLADSYSIVIQFGAIASVGLLYWRYILQMLFGLIGKNPKGLKLAMNLLVAFLPAAVMGLLLHSLIETYLFGVVPVICALTAGAVVMWFAQKKYDARKSETRLDMDSLTLSKSLLIGALQCVALFPGTSRSMMTILGGYCAGLDEKNSARFSFLLGLITLTAASAYKVYKDGHALAEALSPSPLLAGLAVAFVSSALAVKWLVGFLTKHGLVPFAIYRILLAAALSAALLAGLF